MKSSRIICAVAAVSLSLGSLGAFAQGRVYDRNASNNPEIYQRTHPEDAGASQDLQGRNWQRRDGQDRNWQRRDGQDRNWQRRDDRVDYDSRTNDRRYRDNRGDRNDGGPYYYGARSPEFRRGGYIPYEYRNRQYYVNDWRGHHLSAPPRGYQWVQVGGDYVLIALATGLIANLILNQ
jgi:Ni/Co efflux regulator RcnB